MSIDTELDIIRQQESALVFPEFTEDTAFEVASSIRDIARERGLPILIDISRGTNTVVQCSLPGTTPANIDFARRKRNTIAMLHASTYRFALLKADGRSFLDLMALPERDYAEFGGSFPVTVAGAGVIGSITVSGLSDREDHNLIVEALSTYLGVTAPRLP
ncbi:MAG: hypothetical protein RIS25_1380 [Actinomycetota bacterium]|jgi:uncharacterized protein (UPF0303 family)